MDEQTGTTAAGQDAAARLASARHGAELARGRAVDAGRRARELAGGAPADPQAAAERCAMARASLVASLRSSAEAHRRAARTHTTAAHLRSGDPEGHRAEAEVHLRSADADEARAAVLETQAD